MNEGAPSPDQARDNELARLNQLAVFHFVGAGLATCGFALVMTYFTMTQPVMDSPQFWLMQMHRAPPPREYYYIINFIYFLAGFCCVASMILNTLSGVFLRSKKNRMFSMVVAAIDCIFIPLGTALGILTLLALVREPIKELYSTGPDARPGNEPEMDNL